MSTNPYCPHCSGKSKRHGTQSGKQRYRCLVCGKTFVEAPQKPSGRPLILGDRPLTNAEKQKAYRDRKRLSDNA